MTTSGQLRQSHRLLRILKTCWLHRKPFCYYTVLGLSLGLFVSLLLPKEYEAKMLIAPESTSISGDEAMGNLVVENVTTESPARYDALRPSLYPDIFTSTAFLDSLSAIPVLTNDCPLDSALTLREYLENQQYGIFPPSSPNAFINDLRERIFILSDEKTRTVSLICRMQDPLVAATVLDSLSRRIQAYITEYRTRKEREELASAKRLQEEARKSYYRAQEVQAAFEDRNRDLSLTNARKELVKLRVKTNFAREEYVRATLLVHAAETQVVRVRPVFAVIEPATTPIRPSSPSKMKYMAAFALLGVMVGYARIWMKQKLVK